MMPLAVPKVLVTPTRRELPAGNFDRATVQSCHFFLPGPPPALLIIIRWAGRFFRALQASGVFRVKYSHTTGLTGGEQPDRKELLPREGWYAYGNRRY